MIWTYVVLGLLSLGCFAFAVVLNAMPSRGRAQLVGPGWLTMLGVLFLLGLLLLVLVGTAHAGGVLPSVPTTPPWLRVGVVGTFVGAVLFFSGRAWAVGVGGNRVLGSALACVGGLVATGGLLALAAGLLVDPAAARSAEVGYASHYGLESGSITANGEPFPTTEATCAHRHARFGTVLRVRVVATGRYVDCRVNDRGPFVRGRVVDLSPAAARRVGLRGLVWVRVTVLH